MKRALVLLAAVSLLLAVAPPAQAATTYTKSRTWEYKSNVWPNPVIFKIRQSVTFTVKTARECGSLYPCFGSVSWSKGYTNTIFATFDHWNGDVNASGQYSNGVRWRSKEVSAEARYCVSQVGGVFCVYKTFHLRGWITTGGVATWSGWVT